tara:strand:+ start:4229 stop:4438 length:210 start_codon:yes stop_codon:yes gene_type:complete
LIDLRNLEIYCEIVLSEINMTLSRRKAIALFGGGTNLAASSSTETFLAMRTPHAAQAPWSMAGGYDDPP